MKIGRMDRPTFMNPYDEIWTCQNRLPHWEQDDCTYFLSFRLADSLPGSLLAEWQEERSIWLKKNPEPWTQEKQREHDELFSNQRERWLDQEHGGCLLRNTDVREAVEKAIFVASGGNTVWALVLMPKHAHALLSLTDYRDGALGKMMKSWKRASGRAGNQVLGRTGSFWAKDYFDRMIRDDAHFANCARYIRRNPEKAHCRQGEFTLHEHAFVKGILESTRE